MINICKSLRTYLIWFQTFSSREDNLSFNQWTLAWEFAQIWDGSERSWLFIAAADLSLLLVSSWLYLIIQIHLDPPASLSSEEYHGLSLLPWPLCLWTDWVWVNSSINCFPLTVNSDVHSFNWEYWWNMDCVPATVVDVEGAVRNQRIKSHPHGAYIIVGYSHCPTITKYT